MSSSKASNIIGITGPFGSGKATAFSLFEKLDLRDLGINEKITGLQTAFCIALADVFIVSNTSLGDSKKKLENFLKNYGR